MKDGYDWSTNMTSITEQNNLDEFLATAELAGANFTAEKLNVRVRIQLLQDIVIKHVINIKINS